jgi:hypothetical protein
MKIFLTSALFLTLILGCAAPRTSTQAVDGRPKVLVKDAPKGAVLFVDGVSVGQADSYSGGPAVLLLEPGTHLIEIKAGDRLLVSQRIFFGGGELRTISVPGGPL